LLSDFVCDSHQFFLKRRLLSQLLSIIIYEITMKISSESWSIFMDAILW
jgi:hypothetical protein